MKCTIALVVAALGGALISFFPDADAANARAARIVYSFNGADGAIPNGVIDVNGTLYGTTESGGAYDQGAVFSLDPTSGVGTVLYSFFAEGDFPQAGLIHVEDKLYGTTCCGGAHGNGGTVFSIDLKTGAFRSLYSFCRRTGCTDGDLPGPLIDVNGTLYGTTFEGGANCDIRCSGTVFSLNPKTGVETVLYSFCPQRDCAGGSNPESGMINVNGTLYGTTSSGGSHGRGTVFSIDPTTGAEAVVYSFCSQSKCADGDYPVAGLINVNGTLYGTTYAGGTGAGSSDCEFGGCGTAFSVNPATGTETVLHSFCSLENCKDGEDPATDLIDVKGALYGTTDKRGGMVFKLDPTTGAETVLSYFCRHHDCTIGMDPSGLLNVNGTLYGTTGGGGVDDDGTVFSLRR